MNPEPRHEGDYGGRAVEAAHRVLVDLGQILASFSDAMVLVGGWVPALLTPSAEHPHVGSIDVDLALNAGMLGDGRYADLLNLLLDTRRYERGDKDFQLVTRVDLHDGEEPVRVDVEFLASTDIKLQKNRPKLIEGFRVLRFDECAVAFVGPESIRVEGRTPSGAHNAVQLQVVSVPDFIVLKAHALANRDKPKDAYDLCYCLDEVMPTATENWRRRRGEPFVERALQILGEKFASVDHYGPQQVAAFHASIGAAAMHTRRAFELVQSLLRTVLE
jgi:Nucleotidyl transferase AbiEii toxin, Type IV TA system